MSISTEAKIEVKAMRQDKMWQENSLLSFVYETWDFVWFDLSHTENRCHRLSGEEARQQDKAYDEPNRKH